jgi:catechol 2,3-dioxygenase-like lactoylglutathione lyase family enzyme
MMDGSIDAIGMVVTDMAAAVGFYRRLGLEFPDGAEQEQHAEAVLPGGMRLMLDVEEMVAGFDPSWTAPSGRGRIGFAFRCPDPAAVDRTFAELRDAGYAAHAEPWDAFWGQRYAGIVDPDGTVVDLYAPLE